MKVLAAWIFFASAVLGYNSASGQTPGAGMIPVLLQKCMQEAGPQEADQLKRIMAEGLVCLGTSGITWTPKPEATCNVSRGLAKCMKHFLPIFHICWSTEKEQLDTLDKLLHRAADYICNLQDLQLQDLLNDREPTQCFTGTNPVRTWLECYVNSTQRENEEDSLLQNSNCQFLSETYPCFLSQLKKACPNHQNLLDFSQALFQHLEEDSLCQPPTTTATTSTTTLGNSASTHTSFLFSITAIILLHYIICV